MSIRKRYAQVGTGGRSELYRNAILGTFSEHSELVGLCDTNQGRLQLAAEAALDKQGATVPCYPADGFERMLAETKPDCVVVTSMDSTHDRYICLAMEHGCDVVTEKPMTTDAERCRRIVETQGRTGRKCQVTFNYRYSPPRTQMKDLVSSGLIGDILSVDFHWLLGTSHGADYFRRWHRNKENSGGLLVHKATHHFDLVNWWLASVPETVYATGRRQFYTPETAERYGLRNRGERCHGCPEAAKCAFHFSIEKDETVRKLYFDCERHDGYYRDRCVFSDKIDIEDSMSALVSYRNGVKMTYSLVSYAPWEGYIITLNGTLGRIEHRAEETVNVDTGGSLPLAYEKQGVWTRIFPHRKPAYDIDVWEGEGEHAGGDAPLLERVFSPEPPADPYGCAADQRSGAWSILTGIAANESIAQGGPIRVDDLVPGLAMPDY